jgi:hypothetical protein
MTERVFLVLMMLRQNASTFSLLAAIVLLCLFGAYGAKAQPSSALAQLLTNFDRELIDFEPQLEIAKKIVELNDHDALPRLEKRLDHEDRHSGRTWLSYSRALVTSGDFKLSTALSTTAQIDRWDKGSHRYEYSTTQIRKVGGFRTKCYRIDTTPCISWAFFATHASAIGSCRFWPTVS